MTTVTGRGPAVRRWRLRSELRRRREAAGLTQEQVVASMDWSLSKLIRIEAGLVGISTNDLRALLDLYGVRDRRRVESLVDLARASRQRMWWSAHRSVLSPQMLSYVGFEFDAVRMRQFELAVVPELLRTEGYARALLAATDVSGPDRAPAPDGPTPERRLGVLARRQEEVLRRAEPPELLVVLDEAAVRRLVGGPAVMRGQLDHLLTVATWPHVTLQVVPFGVGAHPGLPGAFTVLEFADPAVGDVLRLDAPGDVGMREGADDIRRYPGIHDRLRETALDPAGSVDLVRRIRDGIRPRT